MDLYQVLTLLFLKCSWEILCLWKNVSSHYNQSNMHITRETCIFILLIVFFLSFALSNPRHHNSRHKHTPCVTKWNGPFLCDTEIYSWMMNSLSAGGMKEISFLSTVSSVPFKILLWVSFLIFLSIFLYPVLLCLDFHHHNWRQLAGSSFGFNVIVVVMCVSVWCTESCFFGPALFLALCCALSREWKH